MDDVEKIIPFSRIRSSNSRKNKNTNTRVGSDKKISHRESKVMNLNKVLCYHLYPMFI